MYIMFSTVIDVITVPIVMTILSCNCHVKSTENVTLFIQIIKLHTNKIQCLQNCNDFLDD